MVIRFSRGLFYAFCQLLASEYEDNLNGERIKATVAIHPILKEILSRQEDELGNTE